MSTIQGRRTGHVAVAHAGLRGAVVKDLDKRICIRERCRVIRSSGRDR